MISLSSALSIFLSLSLYLFLISLDTLSFSGILLTVSFNFCLASAISLTLFSIFLVISRICSKVEALDNWPIKFVLSFLCFIWSSNFAASLFIDYIN
ncbi:hypothetical protein OM999_01665 [Mycoplasmopsis cynos]|uniref:hypothetical protein n=1 Tax=Mycoplasmopsis cynos TaxID=171284 RepID=UPI0024CCDAA8|nr:hypothetical protein OM999_01665 [Mycoplasmopsis cynos]